MSTKLILQGERKLAEVLPDAIIILNHNAEILWWNTAAKKLFQLNDKQHKNLQQVTFLRQLTEQIPTKKKFEIQLNHSKGHIAVSLIPHSKNQYLLLARDITHLHHLEIMRQDFVANVSHELRTPLTVIHGYLETLLDEALQKQNAHTKIFQQMFEQSQRMERLITDLLLLSRLETDLPEHEKQQVVLVAPLLQTITTDALTISGTRQHKIYLKIDEQLNLYGSENELRSAFSNIIYNAIHYTPAHGDICISWYKDKRYAYLQVRDSGIGIARKHIPRLTERFYRIDKARSRASGGTGLGLAIVKHALLRHNARLKIESQINKGSTFMCVFPKTAWADII